MWSISNGDKDDGTKYAQLKCNATMFVERNEFNNNRTDGDNVNRFYEKSRADVPRSREGRIRNSGQSSVKRPPSSQRSYMDPVDRNVDVDLQRSQRTCQSEYIADEKHQSHKERPRSFQSRQSPEAYDYESNRYNNVADIRNRQQHPCEQKEKKDATRQKSRLRSESYKNKHRTKGTEVPLSDVSQTNDDWSTAQRVGRKKHGRQTEDKLERVEKKQLHLMQSIQCHQRALVAETKQLFRNEQKQQRLRKDTVEQNLAQFMKKMDKQGPKPQNKEQKQKVSVREPYESVSQTYSQEDQHEPAKPRKTNAGRLQFPSANEQQSKEGETAVAERFAPNAYDVYSKQCAPNGPAAGPPPPRRKYRCSCISDANKVAAFLSPQSSDRTQRATSVESYAKRNIPRRRRNYTAPVRPKSASMCTSCNYPRSTNEFDRATYNDISLMDQIRNATPSDCYDVRPRRI